MFNSNLKSQTINIDSTFTADAEIYPFSPIDTITGFSVSGSIKLNSDTSLVRVILVDEDYNEYMVYEAYPMIVTDTAFDIVEECDETCYLDEISPTSMIIHLYDASLTLESLSLSVQYQDNLDQLQYQAKRNKDAEKIENMNSYIQGKGWNWWADSTLMVCKYYHQKRDYFEVKYNLLGIEYYLGGIYNNVRLESLSSSEELDLVPQFDWREKHDANLDSTPYWDTDPGIDEDGNGWMTGIREQGDCASCAAFGSIGSFEAYINLFYNFHVDDTNDLRLSEKDAFNCSNYTTSTVGCTCSTGKQIEYILDYIDTTGVVNEGCFPYVEPYCEGYYLPDCSSSSKCNNPNFLAKINRYFTFDLDSRPPNMGMQEYLKRKLLIHGPLIIMVWKLFDADDPHCVSLVGFDKDEAGNTVWIMKNSWGFRNVNPIPSSWEVINDHGYVTSKLELGSHEFHPYIDEIFYACFEPDIDVSPLITLNEPLEIQIHDHDMDGYFNWGIVNYDYILQTGWTAPCDTNRDSNDNDGRIGPYDTNFFGKHVEPKLNVYLGDPVMGGVKIDNNEFIYFTDSDLQNDKLKFFIENKGYAYINLDSVNPVFELQNYNSCFDLHAAEVDTQICWHPGNNISEFQIEFKSECQLSYDIPPVAVYKIDIHSVDEDVLEDFEFSLVYYDCGVTDGTYEIPVDVTEVWADHRVVTKNVKIRTGAKLEISGWVEFTKDCEIWVEPGGELLIDGGVLSGACDEFWNGIDVWGDNEHSQFDGHQGRVKIKNGGTIKEAYCGVENRQYHDDGQGGGYYTPTGGIIRANEGVFKDNVIGIKFHPYQNFIPATGDPANNRSTFKNSEFIITQDLYDNQLEPVAGVQMTLVEGIQFSGCEFKNIAEGTVQAPITYRGIGIYSGTAGFYVNMLCMNPLVLPCAEYKTCSFEHLEYGILVLAERESLPIVIDSANFIDNKRGILMSGVHGADIIRNRFEMNYTDSYFADTDTIVGIYLESSSEYVVEENILNGNSGSQPTAGIHILNSGPFFNEVYNNSFEELYAGIVVAGENRNGTYEGLCLKCNDFTTCATDIYVTPNGGLYQNNLGVAQQQGIANTQSDGPASNTFTDNYSGLEYNIDNRTQNIFNYAHHLNQGVYILVPSPINDEESIILQPDFIALYSKQQSCPSNLGGGIDIPAENNNLVSEDIQISAYEDTLNQYVDGGDTDVLNIEVQTSFPDEAMQVRQELLNESPYLSDTVMKSAINKENVLPNAMIRDVLVANPQSAKSSDVINALDQRSDPMPDYMMAEIMQGQNYLGAKEILEKELTRHTINRTKSFNKLTRYYKQDTVNGWALDTLLALLCAESSPKAHYQAAFIYLENGDSISIQNILDNLPVEFTLSNREIINHNLYSDLFDVLLELYADSTTTIDSLQIVTISDISQYDYLLPGIFARNILRQNDLLSFVEPVYLPINLERAPAWDNPNSNIISDQKLLKVFPNPAGHYFIIEFDLSERESNSVLFLSDMNGKLIKSIALDNVKSQQVFNTNHLSPGIYILHLYIGEDIIESHKIEIVN